jgi:hypothetical protein
LRQRAKKLNDSDAKNRQIVVITGCRDVAQSSISDAGVMRVQTRNILARQNM